MMTKRRFQIPRLNDQNLSIDIPLDNFVKSTAVHDYAQLIAATFAVTAATPTFPGFTFNGTTAEIIASTVNATVFSTNDFTLTCWIKPSANTNVILSRWKATIAQRSWRFGIDSSDKLFLTTESDIGVGTTAISSGTITANIWTFVVVTKVGTGANDTAFYINGVASGTGQVEECSLALNSAFHIGSDIDGNFFTGKISQVRIYESKRLSAAEILSLYLLTRWRYSV